MIEGSSWLRWCDCGGGEWSRLTPLGVRVEGFDDVNFAGWRDLVARGRRWSGGLWLPAQVLLGGESWKTWEAPVARFLWSLIVRWDVWGRRLLERLMGWVLWLLWVGSSV